MLPNAIPPAMLVTSLIALLFKRFWHFMHVARRDAVIAVTSQGNTGRIEKFSEVNKFVGRKRASECDGMR